MEREQFTFYASFAKAIQKIRKAADRAIAYDVIVNYALYGTMPDLEELPDSVCIIFDLTKPHLDASRRKAENGQKGGKTEANPKQEEDESKPEVNGEQTGSKPEANRKQEEDASKNKDKNKDKDKNKNKDKSLSAGARFVPPTIEEVQAYCYNRGNQVNAQQFVDFYAAKGWKVGNQPMKDWQAAVRTWEQRMAEKAQPQKKYSTGADYKPPSPTAPPAAIRALVDQI